MKCRATSFLIELEATDLVGAIAFPRNWKTQSAEHALMVVNASQAQPPNGSIWLFIGADVAIGRSGVFPSVTFQSIFLSARRFLCAWSTSLNTDRLAIPVPVKMKKYCLVETEIKCSTPKWCFWA